jgi:hypothetical protein
MDLNTIRSRKIELYEKFFEEMKALEQQELNIIYTAELQLQKEGKNMTEDFIYLDEMRDLKDLTRKEQAIINEQENLYNYNKIKEKLNKYENVYSFAKYLTYVPKWIPFI